MINPVAMIPKRCRNFKSDGTNWKYKMPLYHLGVIVSEKSIKAKVMNNRKPSEIITQPFKPFESHIFKA